MARTPPLSIRIDDARRARWEAAARDAGETLSDYVVDAVDERVAAEGAPGEAKPQGRPRRGTRAATASGVRTAPCEHRIPPTSFCTRCDA